MFLRAFIALNCTMADKGGSKKPSHKMNCGRRCYESRAHKFATLFAMTAGGSNAAQFPVMVIVYGGAPFLVAYLTFLGVVAFPTLRLESNLAQFAGDGNRGIFSTVPLFIGVGYSMTAYAVVHAVADTVQLSDALSLLLSWSRSFYWHHDCPGGWITRNLTCYTIRRGSVPCLLARGRLADNFRRASLSQGFPVASGDEAVLVSVEMYKVTLEDCIPRLLDIAPPYAFRRQPIWDESLHEVSHEEPFYVVATIWAVVFATAHRGILRIKTVFYAFITLHMAATLMLLVRASTLAGAVQGLHVLLYPNWTYITDLEMWSHALYVSLESVGVTGTIYLGVERLNCFKNRIQEDVMFVLVADTASKGIGTVVSFLFLGHLSDSTGISVHMLVHGDFNLVVSITPQAVSLVPYPEFWSRVHSLWVVSMMMPKFLIVPDIIIEVLSASFPPMLVKRKATHFYICLFLFVASVAVIIPGGAKMFSVLSYHQNDLRFLFLVLEIVVIIQLYGVKRLGIDSRLMTGGEPSFFVKFCWTSLTPLILGSLVWVKLMPGPVSGKRDYPILLTAAMTWLGVVELSFILVYAVIFALCTNKSLRDCLVPLPTWVPDNWELAMLYRQQLVAEDPRLASDVDRRGPYARPQAPPRQRRLSGSESSSDVLGTHLILTSEAKVSPSTSDWRYDSSDELKGQPPVKWRSPEKVVRESGTFHKSLRLSAVWRAARAKASPKPPREVLPRKTVLPSAAARLPSGAGRPSLPPPLPRKDSARAAAAASKSPVPGADHLSVEAPGYALHILGDLFRELEHPAYSTLRQRSKKAPTDVAEPRQQRSGRQLPSGAPPAEAKALSVKPGVAVAPEHSPGQRSPISLEDRRASSKEHVTQVAAARSATSDAARLLPEGQLLPAPSPVKEATRSGQLGRPSPTEQRGASRGSLEAGGRQLAQGEQSEAPRQARKATAHKVAEAHRSPRDGTDVPRRPPLPGEAGAKSTPPDAAFSAPQPLARQSSQKSHPESAFKGVEKATSPVPPPAISAKASGKKTPSRSVPLALPVRPASSRKTSASQKKVPGTDEPSPLVPKVASDPKVTDKGVLAPAKTAVTSDEPPLQASPLLPDQVVSPSKVRSPARKARRSAKPEAAMQAPKAAREGKTHSHKPASAKLSSGKLSPAVSPAADAGNAPAVPLAGVAPNPKAKRSKGHKGVPRKKAHGHALPEAGGSKAQDKAAVAPAPGGGSSKAPSAPQPPRRSQRDSAASDPVGKLVAASVASASQPKGLKKAAPVLGANREPATAEPHNAPATRSLPPESRTDVPTVASAQAADGVGLAFGGPAEGAKQVVGAASSGRRSLKKH